MGSLPGPPAALVCGEGHGDRKEGPEPSGLPAPPLQAPRLSVPFWAGEPPPSLLPAGIHPSSEPASSCSGGVGSPRQGRCPEVHTLSSGSPRHHCEAPRYTPSLCPLCPFSAHPLLLLQPARHELHLVLEPSRVRPPLPVAHTPRRAPHTAAAPLPRPLPLLCAWVPGQEGGILPAPGRLTSSSGLRADELGSVRHKRVHTHACGTHTHNEHGHTQVQAHTRQLSSRRTVP